MKLYNAFMNMKFRYKLLTSYILIILLLAATYTVFLSRTIYQIVEDNILESTLNLLNQGSGEINRLNMELIDSLNFFIVNTSIQKIINKSITNYPLSQQLDDAVILESIVENLEKSEDISKIHLYVNDEYIYSREHISFFSFPPISPGIHLKETLEANGGIVWSLPYTENSSDRIITASRCIKSYEDIQKSIGLVSVDVPDQSFIKILENISYMGSHILLFTPEGDIVSQNRTSISLPGKWLRQLADTPGSHVLSDQDLIVLKAPVSSTGWYLAAIIDRSFISDQFRKFQIQFLILSLLILLLSALISILLSDLQTRRIHRLSKVLINFRADGMQLRLPADHKDEIGILEENFNYFLKEIQTLMVQQYELGQNVQRARYDALKAQINPHFLYNAFDLINMMSLKYEVPKISQVVLSLSAFYKLSLNHGDDIICVNDELAHITAYIDFQNYRYQSHVSLEIDKEAGIGKLYVIHLILQPLVENAFLHGLQPDCIMKGRIRITICSKDNCLYLSVEDNGCGSNLDKIKNILNGTIPEKGYGIRNVQERIQLACGAAFGLSYSVSPMGGLKACLKLPLCHDPSDVFNTQLSPPCVIISSKSKTPLQATGYQACSAAEQRGI